MLDMNNVLTFNRTIVELKFIYHSKPIMTVVSFNRTIVELKLLKYELCFKDDTLLIVP